MNNKKIFTRHTKLNYLSQAIAFSLFLPTTSVMADATVECNTVGGDDSTECGVGATAGTSFATAIGHDANASGLSSIAIGVESVAAGFFSSAIGGFSTRAYSTGSTSIGFGAGFNQDVNVTDSPGSIAIGTRSNIGPGSPLAIAIGGTTDISGTIPGTQALAPGAIALGAGVVNGVANSMLIEVPLRIEGSNPLTNSMYLTPNTIGIGIPNPAKSFHIVTSSGSGAIRIEENNSTVQKRYQVQLENNGPTGFRFTDNANGQVWQFSQTPAGGFGFANTANGGQDFVINSDGRVKMGPGPVTNFDLDPNGDLEIPNGAVTATTFHSSSSRASKKDFTKVDTDKLMANIKAMEVTEWRYKDESTKGRHIGPMAEDFYKMFGLGPDDKHVAATDMAGIALIAAKELQKKSDEMGAENTKLKMQVEIQNKRLAQLEKLVMNLASGKNSLSATGKQVVLNK